MQMSNVNTPRNCSQTYINGYAKFNGSTDVINGQMCQKLPESNNQTPLFALSTGDLIRSNPGMNLYTISHAMEDSGLPYFQPNPNYNLLPYTTGIEYFTPQNMPTFLSNQFITTTNNSKIPFLPGVPNFSSMQTYPQAMQMAALMNETHLKPTTVYNTEALENTFRTIDLTQFSEAQQAPPPPPPISMTDSNINYLETINNELCQNRCVIDASGNYNLNPNSLNPPPRPIKITLENEDLWRSFAAIGNEMIITKHGRRIYPYLAISINGLLGLKKYKIKAGFVQASPHRYKYQKTKGWRLGTTNDSPQRTVTVYSHPDGIQSGEFWMSKSISFLRMKVTNNNQNKDFINLNSMHLYFIRIYIFEVDEAGTILGAASYDLETTKFIAVTAYQNKKITKLKIQHNHYAKGFKNGQRKLKESDDEGDDELPGALPQIEETPLQ